MLRPLLCFVTSVVACSVVGTIIPGFAEAAGLPTYLGQGATGPVIPNSGPGSTASYVDPFVATVVASIDSGATLASITFSVAPISGSLTRPLSATYSGARLQSMLASGKYYIPVFGLYAAPHPGQYPNSVTFTFTYTDGTSNQFPTPAVTVVTPSYDDPCAGAEPAASGAIVQNRHATTDLGFDYFLIKNYCSRNTPAIIDSDGFIRWVGTDGAGFPSMPGGGTNGLNYFPMSPITASYYNTDTNSVFRTTGARTLDEIDVPTGNLFQSVNLSGIQISGAPITLLGDHNIDPGFQGTKAFRTMLVGVDTANNLSAALVEINADDFMVSNSWDFADIISSAIIAGRENPASSANCIVNGNVAPGTSCPFVSTTGDAKGDWFHQNSATYYVQPDGTPVLVVSSRENFVMAVDYYPPANGTKKQIKWILGDTTKEWYTNFASLRQYAVTAVGSTPFPIGQHGISFDADGNLLLLSDGLASAYHVPRGATGPTAIYKYSLNLMPANPNKTANLIFGYTDPLAGPPAAVSPIGGSVYTIKSNGNYSYLVNFASQNFSSSQSSQSRYAEVQGLRSDGSLVFDMKFPDSLIPQSPTPVTGVFGGYDLSSGWNAFPLDLSSLQFH